MSETRTDDHKSLALAYLEMANDTYHQAREKRVYFAKLARQHGVTIQEIADAYGVVPGTIRYWLNSALPDSEATDATDVAADAPEGE